MSQILFNCSTIAKTCQCLFYSQASGCVSHSTLFMYDEEQTPNFLPYRTMPPTVTNFNGNKKFRWFSLVVLKPDFFYISQMYRKLKGITRREIPNCITHESFPRKKSQEQDIGLNLDQLTKWTKKENFQLLLIELSTVDYVI